MKIHSPIVMRLSGLCATLCCLLVLLSSFALRAQHTQLNTTGNAFWELCKPQSAFYVGCVYYVIGLTDGLGMANAFLDPNGQPKMFCLPIGGSSIIGSVTGVQTIDIVMSYLQRNPEQRNKDTLQLIIDALKEAYPCP